MVPDIYRLMLTIKVIIDSLGHSFYVAVWFVFLTAS